MQKTGIMKILKKAVAFLVALLALFFYVADDPEIFSMVTDIISPDDHSGIEIPEMVSDAPEQVISYLGYTLSYNNETRLPNWVAYELTAEEAEGENPRKDRFRQDPQAYGPQGDKDDYKHSGWDRGHMAPAGDFKWSEEAMDETYYFTNICPQNTQLNTGDWKELEEQCRRWAVKYGSLYIVCGPIVQENRHGTLGRNKVVIPDKFYKVVLIPIAGQWHGAGFLFDNPPKRKSRISGKPPVKRPLKSYIVDMEELEKMAGIDFFPKLDADIKMLSL